MQLDHQQTMAVRASSRKALVIAGPGSGKTRCIVERAAYLVEECKVSPYEIFMVTFTRKAANEMRERLVERIGNKAYHCTIGTFHATALKLLLRFGDVIGYRKQNSTVYGSWEEQFLLKEVAIDLGLHNGKSWKIPKKDIDAVFSAYYQEGIEPEEDNPVKDLFTAFIHRCKENNSYTYGSILTHFSILLPHIHQYLQYKHIFLDEAHDADRLQWELINSLSKYCDASIYAIADLDQSIYEWRGAAPKYLIDHQDEFTIYRLESNYRSVPAIVEAANNLITHNADRITKTMVATRPDHRPNQPGCMLLDNIDSNGILNILVDRDLTVEYPSGVTILARNHGLLQKLDRLMEEAGIKHDYIGKTEALTSSEPFRRFHAFLKLTVNPYDNFSFLLIRDVVGITREEYSNIRVEAAQEGKSHFQTWFHNNNSYDFMGATYILEEVLEYMAHKFPDLSPEAMAFIHDWKDKSAGHEHNVQEYLNWLATYDIQDEIKDAGTDGITLMTIHASKGLEWPVVIVAGCNEGILPSSHAINNDDIEAERRLAYVAWTRACDQLVLTVRPVKKEDSFGRIRVSPESRFIGESM